MGETIHRYPGAQPFRDDEFSHRTFFGRGQVSISLTDQILANRLVIVYAKSGMGKTSLLNAGVAPRLREAGHLPLLVRVNDTRQGLLSSILEGIRGEARRQQVEYVEGESSSLWSYFKSTEFWRGDLLLTPVLILDQFEELFTLQSEERRDQFLSELGYLIRGVRPPMQPQLAGNFSDASPVVRVVLSLREDFLGMIEDASDRIPEILDHRFRVLPLSREMAANAITGPAAIEDRDIAIKAFGLEPAFVTSILDYLTRSAPGVQGRRGNCVEPFHLQLICERIERIVGLRQQVSDQPIVLSFQDFGSEPALLKTLENFYRAAIQSLPARHLRSAARVLCEQFLISPEGRRLSVEERELRRLLKLPQEILDHLVDRRLLRTDRRSDRIYYELSHDTLVQPVLSTRRMQGLALAWLTIVVGWILFVPVGVAFVLCVAVSIAWFFSGTKDGATLAGALILAVPSFFISGLGLLWIRSGNRRRRRYSPHADNELAQSLPTLLPFKQRAVGWTMMIIGPAVLIVWGLSALYDLLIYGTGLFAGGHAPQWLGWVKDDVHEAWQLMFQRPSVEMFWMAFEYCAILALGWLLLRKGIRKLWPHRFTSLLKTEPVSGIDQQPSLAWSSLKALLGSVTLFGSVSGLFALKQCASPLQRNVLHSFNLAIVSNRLSYACQSIYQKSWDENTTTFLVFFISLLFFAIMWLRDAVRGMRAMFQHRQLAPQKLKFEWIVLTAVACGITVVAALSVQHMVKQTELLPRASSHSQVDKPSPLWAVGNDATILHTEDNGQNWKRQVNGTGWLYSVAFPTQQSGWAVGQHGTMWHSKDSGEHWETQASGTTADLLTVTFLFPASGWAVGNGGTILHTDDGVKWTQQISGMSSQLHSVTFLTRQSGWIVGAGGAILHTGNSGGTWKAQSSGTSQDLFSVAFATLSSGWVAGADGAILHTDDGGDTWKPQSSGTVRNLSAIAVATPLLAWVVGDRGTILSTTDGGNTWKPQNSGTLANLAKAAFVTPRLGWTVGSGGIILHTENGGETWSQQHTGINADLRSLGFIMPRGIIGVSFNADSQPAATPIRTVSNGVTITGLSPDGPARRVGLQPGDIIISVNGNLVKNGDEFISLISPLNPGTDATLVYTRKGKKRTINVTIAEGSNPLPNP